MVIGCRLVIQYLYTGSNPVLTTNIAGWRSRYLVGLITRRSLVRVQPPQRYSLMEYTIFDILKLPKRPVRLGVRTPDFHSGNTSSILVRATFLVMSVV